MYVSKGASYLTSSAEAPREGGVDIYFDDVKMSYTPGRVVQSNEYYAFGLQTANSWTRDNATANNFLGNGGTELNPTTQVYDLDYRNYDPALGRLNQVDPMSDRYGSVSPYHYAGNNPININDPTGAVYADTGSPAPSHWSNDMEEMSSSNKPMPGSGAVNPFQDLGAGLLGYFGLSQSGFGFGDEYAKSSRRQMGLNNALSSANGGSVNVNNGSVSLYNSDQSMAAGDGYNEQHNSWSNTIGGGRSQSWAMYSLMTDGLPSMDVRYTVAALDGPGDGIFRALWNSPLARAIISDYYVIEGGAQGAFGGYLGQNVTMTILLRGVDPGIYVNETKNYGVMLGAGLDATVTFGRGWFYTMNPENMSSDQLAGPQISISAGLEAKPGIGGGVGGTVDVGYNNNGSPSTITLKTYGTFGLGISPPIQPAIGGGQASSPRRIY